MEDKVVVRPGVGMLALFPAMSYKPWYAIGEFVDNALQSWMANKSALAAASGDRATLHIDIDIRPDRIVVTDNAAGIATGDIGRAFTPASPPTDATGLSQFGIGMKSAACWYAKNFSVTTTALGEGVSRTVEFDVPAIIDANSETIPLLEEIAPDRDHGTTLTLWNLHRSAPTGRTLAKVRQYLGSIYRGFLVDDSVRLTVKGERVRAPEPELLKAPRWDTPTAAPVLWRKQVEFYLPSGRRVHGWAGLLAKGSTSQASLALVYRGKVVQGAGALAKDAGDSYKPSEIFGGSTSFPYQRLIGEIDVSSIAVTHTKDSLIWDGDDEEAFLTSLKDEISSEPLPLLKMAQSHRSTERSRAVQATVQATVDSVASAAARSLTNREPASSDQTDPGKHVLASPSVTSSPIPLLSSTGQVSGLNLLIEVEDAVSDRHHWLRVEKDQGNWVVRLNRSHPFSQSFAALPGMDFEPLLRLGVAIAISQIRADQSGSREPRYILAELNTLLSGPLSERNESLGI